MANATTRFRESRAYPRISIDWPVTLMGGSGETVRGRASDITLSGLQVRCERSAVNSLHPGGAPITRENAPRVHVRLTLPLRELPVQVTARCRLVHLTVLPGGDIALGLAFRSMKDEDFDHLMRYVQEVLEPA